MFALSALPLHIGTRNQFTERFLFRFTERFLFRAPQAQEMMVDAKTPECARAAYMATMPKVPAYAVGKHAPAQAGRFLVGLVRGTLPCVERCAHLDQKVGGRPALVNDMVEDELQLASAYREQAQARLNELAAEVKMMRVSSMESATYKERVEAALSPTRDPRIHPARPHLSPERGTSAAWNREADESDPTHPPKTTRGNGPEAAGQHNPKHLNVAHASHHAAPVEKELEA